MSVSTGTIGGNIRSKIRTKYLKVLFAIGFVIIAALYLAFYQLIFGAINEALGVQSRFFVVESAERIVAEYDRIERETAVLRSSRLVQKFLKNDRPVVSGSDREKTRLRDFIKWWSQSVKNPIYYSVTYLNLAGDPLLITSMEPEKTTEVDRDLTTMSNEDVNIAAITLETNLRRKMIEESWGEIEITGRERTFAIALSDSVRILRFVQPISDRKTKSEVGFLAIDVDLLSFLGRDKVADRSLLVTDYENSIIVYDALEFENRLKRLEDAYIDLYTGLQNTGLDTIKAEVTNDKKILHTFSLKLQEPPWMITAMVDSSPYIDKSKQDGLLLVIASLLFVSLSGLCIIVLSRRVEQRTTELIDASDLIATQNRLLEEELEAARELQMGLMPSESPDVTGTDIAGKCQSASQVGGDFFQFYTLPDGYQAIAMADVTGHGMRAAVPTMVFSGLLKNQLDYSDSMEDLFSKLNGSLYQVLEKRTFICFAMCAIDIEKGMLQVANGGCPYPYIYRGKDRYIEELQLDAFPLGLRSTSEYPICELTVESGDRIVFCSDGIIEATNDSEELYGYERTSDAILKGCKQNLGASELIDFVFSQVADHTGSNEQEDDQTMVVLGIS